MVFHINYQVKLILRSYLKWSKLQQRFYVFFSQLLFAKVKHYNCLLLLIIEFAWRIMRLDDKTRGVQENGDGEMFTMQRDKLDFAIKCFS